MINEFFSDLNHIEYGFYHKDIIEEPPFLIYLEDLSHDKVECSSIADYIDSFCESYLFNKDKLFYLLNKNLNRDNLDKKCLNRLQNLLDLYNTYEEINTLMPYFRQVVNITNFALAEDKEDLNDYNKKILSQNVVEYNQVLIMIHNPTLFEWNKYIIGNSVWENETQLGKLVKKYLETKDEYDRLKVIVTLQNQLLSITKIHFDTYKDLMKQIYQYLDSEELITINNYLVPTKYYTILNTLLPIRKCYKMTDKQFFEILQVYLTYVNNADYDLNLEELNDLFAENHTLITSIQSSLAQYILLENTHNHLASVVEEITLLVAEGAIDDPDVIQVTGNVGVTTISNLIGDINSEMNYISSLGESFYHSNNISDSGREDVLKRKDNISTYLNVLDNKVKKVYDFIQNIQGDILALNQHLTAPFIMCGNQILTDLREYLNLVNGVTSKINDTLTQVQNKMQGYIDQVRSIINTLGQTVAMIADILNPNNFISNLLTLLTNPLEAIMAQINQIVCALKAILCALVSLTKGVTNLVSNLDSLVELDGVDSWKKAVDSIKDNFSNNSKNATMKLVEGYSKNLNSHLASSVHIKLGADKAKEFKEEADKVISDCLNSDDNSLSSIIENQVNKAFDTLKDHAKTMIDNIKDLKGALNCKPYQFNKIELDLSLDFSVPHFEIPKIDSSKFTCIGDNDGI